MVAAAGDLFVEEGFVLEAVDVNFFVVEGKIREDEVIEFYDFYLDTLFLSESFYEFHDFDVRACSYAHADDDFFFFSKASGE